MRKRTKAGICPYCSRRHSRERRCEAELEVWEIDFEFRDRQDCGALVAYYEAVVKWESGGLGALRQLGDAYVLNSEPEKAIELLTGPHRQNPEAQELHYVILDALFALGKDENAFDWVERMPIFRVGPRLLDRCHAYLKPKRKARSVFELYGELILDGYCVFTPKELLEAVQRDDRFVVEGADYGSKGIRARLERDERMEGADDGDHPEA